MRQKMSNRGLDRRVFRKTATRSKKINVSPTLYRGGIRL